MSNNEHVFTQPTLEDLTGEGSDYVLNQDSVWITAGQFSIWIRQYGHTAIVEAYKVGDECSLPLESFTVTTDEEQTG